MSLSAAVVLALTPIAQAGLVGADAAQETPSSRACAQVTTSAQAPAADTVGSAVVVFRHRHRAELEERAKHGRYIQVSDVALGGLSRRLEGELKSQAARADVEFQLTGNRLAAEVRGTAPAVCSFLYGDAPLRGRTAGRVPGLSGELRRQTLTVLGISDWSGFPKPFAPATRVAAPDGAARGTMQDETAMRSWGSVPTEEGLLRSKELSAAAPSDSCTAMTGGPAACHQPAFFASRYGLDTVTRSPRLRDARIGLISLAQGSPAAADVFWSAMGVSHDASVERRRIGQVTAEPRGQVEADASVGHLGALSPSSHLDVVEAANAEWSFLLSFYLLASEDRDDVVLTTWAYTEADLVRRAQQGVDEPGVLEAFDQVLAEMAAQGQTVVAASGDAGPYGYAGHPDFADRTVMFPASSPWVLSVGASTVPWATAEGPVRVSVLHERPWSWDYMWAPIASAFKAPIGSVAGSLMVGSGGGYSRRYPQPAYQQRLPDIGEHWALPFVSVQNGQVRFDGTPTPERGHSEGRATPDVVANGDPNTGYLYYSPAAGPNLRGAGGGSSLASVHVAAGVAEVVAHGGGRLGLIQRFLYTGGFGTATDALDEADGATNLYYLKRTGDAFPCASG